MLNLQLRDVLVITDDEDRIVGFGVPPPADEDSQVPWRQTVQDFVQASIEARDHLARARKRRDRRGPFRTIAVGISYGGGQTVSDWYPHLNPKFDKFVSPHAFGRHPGTSSITLSNKVYSINYLLIPLFGALLDGRTVRLDQPFVNLPVTYFFSSCIRSFCPEAVPQLPREIHRTPKSLPKFDSQLLE